MANKNSRDTEEVVAILSVLALAMRGGSTPMAALQQSLENANGTVAEKLRQVLTSIDLGLPLQSAVAEAKMHSLSPALEELLNKLLVANQFGSALAEQLDALGETLASQIAVEKLSRAVASETKMLLPLVFLILPVTVIFALYPSLQILNIQLEGI
jgi:tight adherence protein C